MKKYLFLIISFLLTSFTSAFGQKVKCGGIYPYTYSENISHAEAKAKAVENAIIGALADKFGTTVTSQSLVEMSHMGNQFNQLSKLQVKGKLLKHIHEPQISDPTYADHLFTIHVKVSFYAAPIVYAPTEFQAKILCNGTDDRFENTHFKADDKFYVSFRSPKKGYLAIFFEDKENVVCMLPYVGDDSTPFRVEKEKKYTLFTLDNNTYHMSCGTEPEINYVHILFSPNPFIDDNLERYMTDKRFREWLATVQSFDPSMQVQSTMIKVAPNL